MQQSSDTRPVLWRTCSEEVDLPGLAENIRVRIFTQEMDIAMVQIFMSAGLGFLIASLGQFVSGLVVAFLHGWQLTLIATSSHLGHHEGTSLTWYEEHVAS